jgi:hypothetical protein
MPSPGLGQRLHRAFPPAGHAGTAWCWCSPPATTAVRRSPGLRQLPAPESFAQPEINGTPASARRPQRQPDADGIDNPRAADNLSGTLSLELWALTAPYTSGKPDGVQLAASQLGSLAGQQAGTTSRRPAAGRPPAGTWHIALLLREWTPPAT